MPRRPRTYRVEIESRVETSLWVWVEDVAFDDTQREQDIWYVELNERPEPKGETEE